MLRCLQKTIVHVLHRIGFHRPHLLLALIAAVFATGCSPVRFVVDTRFGSQKVKESTVLRDPEANWQSPKVALIDLSGLIVDARRPGLIGTGDNPIDRFADSLYRAARDARVRAIVVRINSPGGTVVASDLLYRELQHFRNETNKPIVVSMSDVAASGGFYVACAADEIWAYPTTVTGSIGVIIQTFNFSEGLRRIGIRADAITSGPHKAMGSPWEPMPQEHREMLQGLVNEFHANFMHVVSRRFPELTEPALSSVTDGRVISGRTAHEHGLVDGLGDLRDAYNAAKRLAGVDQGRLVKYHRDIAHVTTPYAHHPEITAAQFNMLQLNVDGTGASDIPGFYYLWDPTVWR